MFPGIGPAYDLPLDEFEARFYRAQQLRDWWTGSEAPPHIRDLFDLIKQWSKPKKRRRRRTRPPSESRPGPVTPPNGPI